MTDTNDKVRQYIESEASIGGIPSDYPRDNPYFLDGNFDFNGLPVYWSHKTWGYNHTDPKHRIGAFYYGEKANIFEGDSAISNAGITSYSSAFTIFHFPVTSCE